MLELNKLNIIHREHIVVLASEYTIAQVEPCSRMIVELWGRVYLPFPYILFAHERRTLWVGFANQPIVHDNDLVYFPPLGNMYPSFRCCLGGYSHPPRTIEQAIQKFWFATFGDDGAFYKRRLLRTRIWKAEKDATKIQWPVATTFKAFRDFRS